MAARPIDWKKPLWDYETLQLAEAASVWSPRGLAAAYIHSPVIGLSRTPHLSSTARASNGIKTNVGTRYKRRCISLTQDVFIDEM
jgi:hypothetical protein